MWKPIKLDVECIVCNKTLQKINHDPREVSRKMGKITNRRSRTPNWSLDEKQYLLELIREFKEIVVTKSNNGPNHSEEKDVAWNEILSKLANKFGSKFSEFSIKKVKTQWQNMKRIAREEIQNNGSDFGKYTKQSLDVCKILQLIKDGVVKNEGENFNDSVMAADVEIKTECIDEDMAEPSCSYVDNDYILLDNSDDRPEDVHVQVPSETTSASALDHLEAMNGNGQQFEDVDDSLRQKRNMDTMTETQYIDDMTNIFCLRKELEDLIRNTTTEKQLKLDSLKDERQVFRAMRETAELNKIIAEQKLKHVLWIKKQEMA